jgi:hypothetical protein
VDIKKRRKEEILRRWSSRGAFLIFTFEFADYGTRQFSFQLFSPQTISNNSWKFFFSTCPGFYSSFRNIYFFFIFFVFALWIHIFLIAFISCYIVCLFFPLSFRRLAQVFFLLFYREIIMVSELNIVRWTVGLLWSHFIDKHTHIVDWEREARCNYDELKERERERESWLRKRRPFVKFRQEQQEKGATDEWTGPALSKVKRIEKEKGNWIELKTHRQEKTGSERT